MLVLLVLLLLQPGADDFCRQVLDDEQLTPRMKALRARELARGLDPELLRRYVLYVRRYRYPVGLSQYTAQDIVKGIVKGLC